MNSRTSECLPGSPRDPCDGVHCTLTTDPTACLALRPEYPRPFVAGPIDSKLLPVTALVTAENRLMVGGKDLIDLADEFGTPLFVYDEYHLRKRCREAVFAWGAGVAYASKAFLCMAMAKLAHDEGMHLDVATAGEAYTALRAGVPPERLIFHGNNKSSAELSYALERGIGRIVVDSFDELDRLKRLAGFGHATPKVLLRITPGVEAHTHEFVQTGQEDSKFGFSLSSGAAMDAVLRCRNTLSGVNLVGIHCHIGSQIFDVAPFLRALDNIAPFFTPLGLPELVVGGGIGVPYVESEDAPSIGDWASTVRDHARSIGISASVQLTAEPGRAIVATAGMTVYRVGTIKELPDLRTYVSVDGGMSDNPRPVMYGSGYEAFLPRAAGDERDCAVRLVGKHCESGDRIIDEAWLPRDLVVGDILVTPVTGAYGYSMASNYNRVPRPAVVFVADGIAKTVVRRETYDDVMRNDL